MKFCEFQCLPKISKIANHDILKVVFLLVSNIGLEVQAASIFSSFDPIPSSFVSDELFVSLVSFVSEVILFTGLILIPPSLISSPS